MPELVPRLSQLPLELPPKPTSRKAVLLHFLELHTALEPVFSALTALEVCSRSKTRLVKEKQEGMKIHSTSGLLSLPPLAPRRVCLSSCTQTPGPLLAQE